MEPTAEDVKVGPNAPREYLPPPPSRKGHQQSPVWEFLKRFVPVNDKGHNIECFVELLQEDGAVRSCGCTIKWSGPSSGTTNLLTHLKKYHPVEHQLCLERSKHSALARGLETKAQATAFGTPSSKGKSVSAPDDDDNTAPPGSAQSPGAGAAYFGGNAAGAGGAPGGQSSLGGRRQPDRDDDRDEGMDDGMDEDEDEGFVTMSQLQHQQPTFPAEEALGSSHPGKIVNDPVHGHMYFPGVVVKAIDTPQVQRLRELKQLGTAYYVFPGASHNRFEHSLGTCHLATNVYEALRRSSGKEVRANLDRTDKISIQLAALCHDLGHGPFSHVFDNEFLPRRNPNWDPKNPPWNHEDMSAKMFDWIVDSNYIEVDEDVKKRVCALITSDDSGAEPGKKFLWDIVANKRNSVDVDKFEYIMRDAHNAGVKGSVDISRLVSFMKVIDDKICFKASEVFNVYELFHTRASLHQKVYTHKKAKAIEYMSNKHKNDEAVVDALHEADIAWKNEISDAIWDVEEFIRLDDSILKKIEWSKEAPMQKARDLVRRIRTRDLYQYVNEYAVPEEDIQYFKPVTEIDITSCQGDNGIPNGLRPEDIVVQNLKIDYAMKEKNPVDSVKFFQEYTDTTSFKIDKNKVSVLLPSNFMERKVRVFSKNRDPMYVEAVEEAFVNHQRKMYKTEQQVTGTPARKRPRSSQQ